MERRRRLSTDPLAGEHRRPGDASPTRRPAQGVVGLQGSDKEAGIHLDPFHGQKKRVVDHPLKHHAKYEMACPTGLVVPSHGRPDPLQEDPFHGQHKVPPLPGLPQPADFKGTLLSPSERAQKGTHVDILHGLHVNRTAAPPPRPNPCVPTSGTPSHLPEMGRLNIREAGGFAEAEHARRQQDRETKEAVLHRKREDNFEREQNRWQRMDQNRETEERRAIARVNITEFHKNDHSVPYDVVTSDYARGAKGEQLRATDEAVMGKALQRAQTIQSRSYSQPYNPITGAPVVPVEKIGRGLGRVKEVDLHRKSIWPE